MYHVQGAQLSYNLPVEKLRHLAGSLSPLSALAVLSVAGVLGVSAWRTAIFIRTDAQATTYSAQAPTTSTPTDALTEQEMLLLGLATSANPSAEQSDVDPLSLITPQVAAQLVGQYMGLVNSGAYSQEAGQKAAEQIAGNVKAAVTYKTYTSAELKTDSATSYERMLTYKDDLRTAFAPLLKNTEDEFEIYASYVESGDRVYLERLSAAAVNYRLAAEQTAQVIVPKDALRYHVAILNAMEEFAATLDALSTHADDPLTAVALLRTYSSAEQSVLFSFNDLGTYYRSKTP